MTRTLGVAGIQLAPVPHDVDATWAKAARLVRNAVHTWDWIELVLLPELTLHGVAPYEPSPLGDWMAEVAEPIPGGPTTERIQELARELGVWLVNGSIYERDGDAIHNTSVAVSPDGEIVAKYRKQYPWQPYETTTAGTDGAVFEIPGKGTIGMTICYDMWFPEVCRELMWQGAEVILHPSLTSTWDRKLELVLAQANAVFNQCYFLDVNAANGVGGGNSIFVDPNGQILYAADTGEEVFAHTVDFELVERVRTQGTLGLNRLLVQAAERRASAAAEAQ
jgi:formamidase